MLLSIVVPVYNVEKYLKKCVESLINQTYKNIEILLIDDGSTDNSLLICKSFEKKDKRIKIIHKKNGGLSDARNVGIDNSKGEYIILVDSDDYIELDSCEIMLEYFKSGADIIAGNAYRIEDNKKNNMNHISHDKIISGEEFLLKGFKEKCIPMASWLLIYKRSFLEENQLRFKVGIFHEDEEFTPRALLVAKTVCSSSVYFYNYIIRDNSITTKKDKSKNAKDLYLTFCELEQINKTLNNLQLQKYFKDSFTTKYLSLFRFGEIYQYGKEYYHKKFILRNAVFFKTKVKALIYFVSPKLYCFVGNIRKH